MTNYPNNSFPTRQKKDKYVPVYGQNVLALEPQPGMENVLEWLKAQKLHRYWPMISRFSYVQLVNLNEDNWEATLASAGVRSPHAVTRGAQDRFLRLTGELRSRPDRLKEALRSGSFKIISETLSWVLRSPLADVPEVNGEELVPLIRQAYVLVKNSKARGK